jgi:hypothetical protein
VHSHAFSSADCNIFLCNKVVGGHAWWKNSCGPKHYWWHAKAAGTPFVVVGDAPTAEIEVLIPARAPLEALPRPSGERPVKDGIALQGMVAAADAIVSMNAVIGIIAPDGKITHLVNGAATLGGPKSAAPGLKASGDLRAVLSAVAPGGEVARAAVRKDFVSRRISVPTNKPLDFHFELSVDIGGDDPKEGRVRDSSPAPGQLAASAASLAATLRLVDQSGAFALKDLEQEDDSGDEGDPIGRGKND